MKNSNEKRYARRLFLKRSGAVAGAAVAAGVGSGGCATWMVKDKSTIPTVKSPSPESTLVQITSPEIRKNLGPALVRLLEPLGGMQAFVKKGQTVLLKPNMGFDKPAAFRANTSAELIAAVAKLCLEQGASKVIVADHSIPSTEDVSAAMGLSKALKGLKVQVLKVDGDSTWVETAIPQGESLHSTEILKVAFDADVHIALPIAKSHSRAGFTGTLKGMMGLIKSRMGFHLVRDLHKSIVDLNRVLKPNLIIMDGMEVMATDGPQGPGKLIRANSLIAGTDPVAVDSAGVRLVPLHGKKVEPATVRHLAIAAASGIGRIDSELPKGRVHKLSIL